MPVLVEDVWISEQAVKHTVAEIEDCAIAVDATYYLQQCLDHDEPLLEPLVPALGGLTSLQNRIEEDLDQWDAHRVTPFFIFNGQTISGQDDVSTDRGLRANIETDQAWDQYFSGDPERAVQSFGLNPGAFPIQDLYPLLQGVLRQRKLHFLVPPYNAAAQIAYFEMIDSDQCAGVMGPQELLLYPIKDSVIRSIDWEANVVTAISKRHVLKALNVPEALFIDAFLMTGTTFLPRFPPLMDPNIIKVQPFTIVDAVNLLRTSDKSVTQACNSCNDILKLEDPNWLDKYRKARMVVNHFIYITEEGEIKVHDYDRLTSDNYEYLGLQLPSELFHYVNTGLIGPRVLSWITHGQLNVLPTLDGTASTEYRKLVSNQLIHVKEATLGLLMPRLHRGVGMHKAISMKVWYNRNFAHKIWDRDPKPEYARRVASWTLREDALREYMPEASHGSIAAEVLALKNSDLVRATFALEKGKPKALESSDAIISVSIWRWLHLRGYVNDSHQLTTWGSALATALTAVEAVAEKFPTVPYLCESVLMAFEMIRFDLLNTKNQHTELGGYPMNGSEEDQASLLLIIRCATLLRLRHRDIGYTGPLSKNLLAFRSLVYEVRTADRDLVEAVVASMFMFAQANRHRDDSWELSHRLPFLFNPDVGLAIAVKTWLDDIAPSVSAQDRDGKKESFHQDYVPFATHLWEDVEICYLFFDAVHAGVKTLDGKTMSSSDRAEWDKAAQFLETRR